MQNSQTKTIPVSKLIHSVSSQRHQVLLRVLLLLGNLCQKFQQKSLLQR